MTNKYYLSKNKHYIEGKVTYQDGGHWTGCDYPYWSEEFERWHEGYFDAKEEKDSNVSCADRAERVT